MLFSLVISLLFVVFSSSIEYQRLTLSDKEITDETFKKLLRLLGTFLGDSQEIPDQSVFINNTLVLLNGSMWNVHAYFDDYNVHSAHVNMTTLDFRGSLSYGSIRVYGNYSLYADNDYLHMESSDIFSVNISSIDLDVCMKLKLNDNKTLEMDKFDMDYNATLKIRIEDLGGSDLVSWRLNNLTNQLLPGILEATKPLVKKAVATTAKQLGDNFLFRGMTLQEFIDYINQLVSTSLKYFLVKSFREP